MLRRKGKIQTLLALACLFLLPFPLLLGGCSGRFLENMRIFRKAERVAERRAEAYIRKKYQIQAKALGYDVQGGGALAFTAVPGVLVPMTDGTETFCVYLDLDNEWIGLDNRQAAEITAALEDYFLSVSSLEPPERSKITFTLWNDAARMSSHAMVKGKSYSAENMADFFYEGQSAGALLDRIQTFYYEGHFTGLSRSLEEVKLAAGDWPQTQEFRISTRLYLYRSREWYQKYGGVEGYDSIKPKYWPTLRESAFHLLSYEAHRFGHAPDSPRLEDSYSCYQTRRLSGLDFTGILPFDPEGCIVFPEGSLVWKMETPARVSVVPGQSDAADDKQPEPPSAKTDAVPGLSGGHGGKEPEIQTYTQISPLFAFAPSEELLNAYFRPDIEDKMVCTPGPDYVGEDGILYVGRYWPQSGRQSVFRVYPDLGGSFRLSNLTRPPDETDSTRQQDTILEPVQYAILRPADSILFPAIFLMTEKAVTKSRNTRCPQ